LRTRFAVGASWQQGTEEIKKASNVTTVARAPPKAALNKTYDQVSDHQLTIREKHKKQGKTTIPLPLNMRHFDNVATNTNITSAGVLADEVDIPQGQTDGQRVGDAILLHSLEGIFSLSTQNSDVFNNVRCLLIKWLPNSALLVPVTSSILTSATPWSMHTWTNENTNFIVLWDKLVSLSGTATNPCSSGNQNFGFKFNFGGELVRYASSATSGPGHYFLMFISDSAAPPYPVINYTVRVVYENP